MKCRFNYKAKIQQPAISASPEQSKQPTVQLPEQEQEQEPEPETTTTPRQTQQTPQNVQEDAQE